MKQVRTVVIASIFLAALAGCGGGGGGGGVSIPPTSGQLNLGSSGPVATLGSVDITFPVFSNYSVTAVTGATAGLAGWDRVASSVRVLVASTSGVPVGATYASVQFAIKDGRQPLASDFMPASAAVFKNLSGNVVPGITPTFAITNVR